MTSRKTTLGNQCMSRPMVIHNTFGEHKDRRSLHPPEARYYHYKDIQRHKTLNFQLLNTFTSLSFEADFTHSVDKSVSMSVAVKSFW